MIEAKPENLIGDRAYDSDPLDEQLRREGVEMIAPHRSNRKRKTQDGRRLRRYERRWIVERFFARIQWRRYWFVGSITRSTSSASSTPDSVGPAGQPLALPPMRGRACRRLAPPAKGGGVGNSATSCKELLSNRSGRGRSTCSSGKSVLAVCTLVQNMQHSRAEARATLFRPIQTVPKASPMYHSICPAHTARSPCFVPAFHQSPRRHKELFGSGLRRIKCCDRFGVLAVLHCGARFPTDMEVSPY